MIAINSPVNSYVIRRAVRNKYEYLLHTANWQRKDCIDNYRKGYNYTWKELKSFGWECVKIKIDFTLLTPTQ